MMTPLAKGFGFGVSIGLHIVDLDALDYPEVRNRAAGSWGLRLGIHMGRNQSGSCVFLLLFFGLFGLKCN